MDKAETIAVYKRFTEFVNSLPEEKKEKLRATLKKAHKETEEKHEDIT